MAMLYTKTYYITVPGEGDLGGQFDQHSVLLKALVSGVNKVTDVVAGGPLFLDTQELAEAQRDVLDPNGRVLAVHITLADIAGTKTLSIG